MPLKDSFGFLMYPEAIRFPGVVIEPVENFQDNQAFIHELGNQDGYFYPPQVHTVSTDIATNKVSEVPNSGRPAAMFCMPPSHDLVIERPIAKDQSRFEDGALVVHLLAFFFGTRLQFSGWKFDSRVPIKPTNSFTFVEATPPHFFSWVYRQWKAWEPELRKRYINILYVHGRAKCYEQYWEAFIHQYLVFDAIYKFYVLKGGREIHGHKNRLIGLCEKYEIPYSDEYICKIYSLRNDLFHEASWDGGTPGFAPSEAFRNAQWLERLNSRLIVAVTGYSNQFSKSGWWFYGWQQFDSITTQPA